MENRALLELRRDVVAILAKNNCTIREAQYILTQASRMIEATSKVQFSEEQLLEF